MYRRFCTICLVIGIALLVLSAVGIASLKMHARGLQAERQGQFVAVAEQIRLDIKSKLDEFLQAEQRRPYTDYQYAYVPDTTTQTDALMRSPLADTLTHSLAFGHFQIDAQGNIITPYAQSAASQQQPPPELAAYLNTLRTDVLDALRGQNSLPTRRRAAQPFMTERVAYETPIAQDAAAVQRPERAAADRIAQETQTALSRSTQQPASSRARTYPIESLQETQQTQTLRQTRDTAIHNVAMIAPQQAAPEKSLEAYGGMARAPRAADAAAPAETETPQSRAARAEPFQHTDTAEGDSQITVQIRIEPFTPLAIPVNDKSDGIFPGQIFLIRHVQIENTHLLQGFCLNEDELIDLVRQSARRLLREGMDVELAQVEHPHAAYTAILDFGFGQLMLNLLEMEPGWIAARVARLNTWLIAILTVVWLAVILAMLGLWRSLHDQVILARKKDDFISAVSHELRTPLTSIRMYTEMLEKGWVKDDTRKREYYGTMRQESERLSRLIENVLDFSRIQRGKKQFDFTIGDVNGCIRDVVEMMRPCALQSGFTLETKLSDIEPFAFDRDAVTQIVINLIDNALKYAKEAADKQINIRTHTDKGSVIIEIEDHGPGIPRNQQKRIFEAFYRCGDEATRQTTGTGLGLALVKRFALAHRGFVEVLNAKPRGSIFRVRLAR